MQLEYNIYFELSAAIFMMLLILYVRLQFNIENERNRLFFRMGVFLLIADILDVITAITISNGDVILPGINIWLNTAYFISNGLLSFFFLDYSLQLNGKNGERKRANVIEKGVLALYIVLILINVHCGWIFTFNENGDYVHAPIYLIVYVVPYLYFTISAVYIVQSMKYYDVKQKWSIVLYIVLSMSGVVLQIVCFPNVLLNIFMIALGFVVILFSLETPEYQKLIKTMEELKVANEKAQAANEAKSHFLARMSHEIRTPINAVLGMDEMILRESTEPQILEYAKNIDTAGNTLLTLINDILDLSKIESGKMELYPAPYDVTEMIQKIRLLIQPKVDEKKLSFYIECDSSMPQKLCGDELRIRQMIINLLTNAVKYTKEGSVTLRMKWKKEDEENITFLASVEDTGIGISQENQAKLFTSFERVDEKTVHNIEGTGLGLSITKQMAELMDGTIGVYSTPGEGSLFYVEIPQKVVSWGAIGVDSIKVEKQKKRKEYHEKFHAPQAKILVVDDVPINLTVMKNLLKATMVSIDTATSGAECLEMCKEQAYDLILLDHMMPEMDGVETLKHLKKDGYPLNSGVPVIMLTANAINGAEEEYKEVGFDGYVSKPATGETLENMLIEFLPKNLIQYEDEN